MQNILLQKKLIIKESKTFSWFIVLRLIQFVFQLIERYKSTKKYFLKQRWNKELLKELLLDIFKTKGYPKTRRILYLNKIDEINGN